MKNKYKWCKTCVANEWRPLKPPTNYRNSDSRTLVITLALLKRTIADAIEKWATQNEVIDKFGDITLEVSCKDRESLSAYISRSIRKLI